MNSGFPERSRTRVRERNADPRASLGRAPQQLRLLVEPDARGEGPRLRDDYAYHALRRAQKILVSLDPSLILPSSESFVPTLEVLEALSRDHWVAAHTSLPEGTTEPARTRSGHSFSAHTMVMQAKIEGAIDWQESFVHVVDGIEDRGWIAAACDDYLHEGTIPLVVGTHESRDGLTRDLVELLRPDVLLVVCPGTTPPPVVPALRTPRPGRTHRWLEGDARTLDAIAPILRSRFETAVHAAQRGVVSALLDGRRARAIADALDGDVAGFVLHR